MRCEVIGKRREGRGVLALGREDDTGAINVAGTEKRRSAEPKNIGCQARTVVPTHAKQRGSNKLLGVSLPMSKPWCLRDLIHWSASTASATSSLHDLPSA